MCVLKQGVQRSNPSWCFSLDKEKMSRKKLAQGGEIMEEVRGMGELELESGDESESEGGSELSFGVDQVERACGGRRTKKRVPISARNVGRSRRK